MNRVYNHWDILYDDVLSIINPVYKWQFIAYFSQFTHTILNGKIHGANMGPIWGRQDPGGLHVGPMNFAIWDALFNFGLVIVKKSRDQFQNMSFIEIYWATGLTTFNWTNDDLCNGQ